MDLTDFVEEKLNHYAQRIIDGGANVDDHAFGELAFYLSVRRVLSGKATRQDVGMMDAINDTLQGLGLMKEGKTFLRS